MPRLCLHDRLRHDDPAVQPLLSMIDEAQTLTQRILAVWPCARVLARHSVASVLAARAQRPSAWPPCPTCGTTLRSQGVAQRQRMRLCGPIRWRRRVGRWPHGGDMPQVAPCAAALGVEPQQRPRGELQALGCALAVFGPLATAARVLGWDSGGVVSPRAVGGWVQAAGPQAMASLPAALAPMAQGPEPTPEPLAAERAVLPLALGADGVLVPWRPPGGKPQGKIRWRAITVGVLARLGQHCTRPGHLVTRLPQRRLVAVLGDSERRTPRLGLAALRQGSSSAPQGGGLRDGGRGVGRLFAEQCAEDAIGVLDCYHAAQNLWQSAAAWLDGRTPQARRGFGGARHRLRHGRPDGVLADLTDA